MVRYTTSGSKTEAASTANDGQVDPYEILHAQAPDLQNLTKETFPNYTSLIAAYGRAIEAKKDKPLLNDMYAEALAGKEAKAFCAFFKRSIDNPENMANFVLRHLVIDEEINNNLGPIRQVVLVGSGMDTRSYRLHGLKDCHVFEMDASRTFAEHKHQVLKDMNAVLIPKEHDVVITDLAKPTWTEDLVAQGFDVTKPVLWIVEALLEYMDEASVDQLFTIIDSISAPESKALVEMCGTGAINMDIVMHNGEVTWHIGTTEKNHQGGVLRALPWDQELLIQRNQDASFIGSRWDAERFASFNEAIKITLGTWYVKACTKPKAP